METIFKKSIICLFVFLLMAGLQFESLAQGKSEKGKEKKRKWLKANLQVK